jgi:hypothetical protein
MAISEWRSRHVQVPGHAVLVMVFIAENRSAQYADLRFQANLTNKVNE